MTTVFNAETPWQEQGQQYWLQGDYQEAAQCYELAIDGDTNIKSNYWYLGLMLLLLGQEVEAQTTWLLAIAQAEAEQVDEWTRELILVLEREADRQQNLGDYSVARAIRLHIREICPTEINNLLHLLELSILLESYTDDEFTDLGLNEFLLSEDVGDVDIELLIKVLKQVLDHAPLLISSLEFASACLPHIRNPLVFLNLLMMTSVKIAYSLLQPKWAIQFAELCLKLDDKNLGVLQHLSALYQNIGSYNEGIRLAKLCYSLSETVPDKIFANYKILRGLMGAGSHWQEVLESMEQHQLLLERLLADPPSSLAPARVQNLFTTAFFLPYFQDQPQKSRLLQNKLSQFCQDHVQNYATDKFREYQEGHINRPTNSLHKPLKIGYVSHCLNRHSVGWLVRSLIEHHHRDRVSVYLYFLNYKNHNDWVQDWYVNHGDRVYKGGFSAQAVAEQIYQDEVDILIELDSITLDIICELLSLKPAPIQVSWLGCDASGLPAVDYFIADRYVLPENAQDYYREKIWRLPSTYIAVDGFEVGIPNLRREHLGISSDAVIYFSGQKGYKRHPDTARLQMKIIAQVPNSYFLIKGNSDEEGIRNFFMDLAEEEGVESERLRFLPEVDLEAVHRANLGIVDVVLDTYPYNGATTTLETLWMGIPIVTRVGEQFVARNSYTMMMNAGITEGIACTDEEYVEWGVRLGKDAALRQQISWRLRQSRSTSPLWNGEQFAGEMENAYEQMWQIYHR